MAEKDKQFEIFGHPGAVHPLGYIALPESVRHEYGEFARAADRVRPDTSDTSLDYED